MLTIIPFPVQDEPQTEFFMGVDQYGFDNRKACAIVMKRTADNRTSVVAMYTGRPSVDFEAEVKRMTEHYKIPENNILKMPK